MAWVKLDDQFFYHPKVIAAGRDARDLYIAALSYSAGQLTDGHIQEGAIGLITAMAQVPDGSACVKRLVEVGLWEQIDGGYLIHDYLKYNPSAEQVKALRTERAEAGKQGARQTNQQRWGNRISNGSTELSAKVSANVSSSDDDNYQQIIAPYPYPYPIPIPIPDPAPSNTPDGVPSGALAETVDVKTPRQSTRQREPYPNNPAIQAFQDVFKCRPKNRDQAIAITNTIEPTKLSVWVDVMKAWNLHAYNPQNIPGMLEWYRTGIPKNGNGKARAAPGMPPQIPIPADEAMRRNIEDNGDWLQ